MGEVSRCSRERLPARQSRARHAPSFPRAVAGDDAPPCPQRLSPLWPSRGTLARGVLLVSFEARFPGISTSLLCSHSRPVSPRPLPGLYRAHHVVQVSPLSAAISLSERGQVLQRQRAGPIRPRAPTPGQARVQSRSHTYLLKGWVSLWLS